MIHKAVTSALFFARIQSTYVVSCVSTLTDHCPEALKEVRSICQIWPGSLHSRVRCLHILSSEDSMLSSDRSLDLDL